MREVTAHPRSVPAADIPVEPDEEPRHNAPQSYDGAPPPVADFATPRPTASERAYDDGDFVSRLPQELVALIAELSPESIVELLHAHADMSAAILTTVERVRGATFAQQVSSIHPMHKPTPTEQPVAARHAPPPAPTPPADAERAKRAARSMTAAWDQLAIATPDERATPESVRLPPNIVKQLEQAWQDSLAGKQEREQGGNLVRNPGGSYEIRRSPNENARIFEGDESDIGWRQKFVGQVHTHPYRDEKDQVPEQFATFSEGDFDSLMRSDAHMSMLRSGPYTFVLSKTKQFDALVKATNNDEEKLKALAARMTAVYDKAYAATIGSFSEKTEAGVLAVCGQFHLAYYTGEGSDLTRKTKQ